MIKTIFLIVTLSSFLLSGCVDKNQKTLQSNEKSNNDTAVIHYIGDQEAFAN